MGAARLVAQIGARIAQHDPADKADQDRHRQADGIEPDGEPQMLPDQQFGGDRPCRDQLHQRRNRETQTGEQTGFQRPSRQAGMAIACEQRDSSQSGKCGDPDRQAKRDVHRSVSVRPRRGQACRNRIRAIDRYGKFNEGKIWFLF